jgi:hypothetical protein
LSAKSFNGFDVSSGGQFIEQLGCGSFLAHGFKTLAHNSRLRKQMLVLGKNENERDKARTRSQKTPKTQQNLKILSTLTFIVSEP